MNKIKIQHSFSVPEEIPISEGPRESVKATGEGWEGVHQGSSFDTATQRSEGASFKSRSSMEVCEKKGKSEFLRKHS